MATAGTSKYKITPQATRALNTLNAATSAPERYYDDLNSYVTDEDAVRQDYRDLMDYGLVKSKYDQASDAAWDLARLEQIQAMNTAEAQNYANTQSSIAQMRNALAGSASSGANRGAANATALQALLGLGQTNAQTTTEAMQGYQNVNKEQAAARAQNAISALEMNKNATDAMYSAATSAYGSDKEALGSGAYGAGQGLGTIGGAVDTAASNERMNNATNKTTASVANTEQKSKSTQTIINKKG